MDQQFSYLAPTTVEILSTGAQTQLGLSGSGEFSMQSYSYVGDFINPTTYSRSKREIRGPMGVMENNAWDVRYSGNLSNYAPNFYTDQQAIDWAYLYDTALLDCLDKIRGGIDLSIDGAQWRQTKEISSNLTRSSALLASSVKREEAKWMSLRSRYPRKRVFYANKAFKAVSALWLTWQYGIRPTLNTVQELKDFKDPIGTVTVKGKASSTSNYDDNSSSLGIKTHIQKARVRYTITYALRNNALENAFRLSTFNPVGIGYELLPFSFVLDWVVDIGGWLRGMETVSFFGENFVRGYIQAGDIYTLTWLLRGTDSNGSVFNAIAGADVINYSRTPLVSLPIPSYPSVKVKLGAERLISAISLLSNLLPNQVRARVLKAR